MTVEMQRKVAVRIAVQRLGRGILIGPSIGVLARLPLEASWDRLRDAAESVHHLYYQLRPETPDK